MRLTYKYEKSDDYGSVKLKNLPPDPLVNKLSYLDKVWEEQTNKLGQLEDIEEELGVDLIQFLKECKYVLEHSLSSTSKTSKGTIIDTDFGYVQEFINDMKKALIKEELINEK